MSHYSYIKSNHLTHLLATCIPYVQDSAEYNFALYYALHYVLLYTVQYAIHFALHYALHYVLRYGVRSTQHYSLHSRCIIYNY